MGNEETTTNQTITHSHIIINLFVLYKTKKEGKDAENRAGP